VAGNRPSEKLRENIRSLKTKATVVIGAEVGL